VALRATYVIDPKGVVRAVTMHDLPVGRSVEETLRTVKAFQVSRAHDRLLGEAPLTRGRAGGWAATDGTHCVRA
jgi:alkyl hydroperoxide reductase subunit AhpC